MLTRSLFYASKANVYSFKKNTFTTHLYKQIAYYRLKKNNAKAFFTKNIKSSPFANSLKIKQVAFKRKEPTHINNRKITIDANKNSLNIFKK